MGGGVGGAWANSTSEGLGAGCKPSLGAIGRLKLARPGSSAGRLQLCTQSSPDLRVSGQPGQPWHESEAWSVTFMATA